MGILIVPIAMSGSGKSTLAERWIESGRMERSAIIQPDGIRLQMTGDESDQSANDVVFRVAHMIARERLSRDLTVFFDATNLTAKAREDLIATAQRTNASIVWVTFTVSWGTAVWRNSHRDRQVPIEILQRQWDDLSVLDVGSLPGSVISVDSTGSIVS